MLNVLIQSFISNIEASVTGACKTIIISSRGESLCKEKLSLSQAERDGHNCLRSEQQSSSNPSWSQKEDLLADGSKELSYSFITGYSGEAIVDIDASATRLSSHC